MSIIDSTDNIIVTDFGADSEPTESPDRHGDQIRFSDDIIPLTPKPLLPSESDPKEACTGIATAQIRRGTILPNGRIAGWTDQIIHVVRLPATGEPATVQTLCGLVIEAKQADAVPLLSGPPCTRCLFLALRQRPSGRSFQQS